MDFSVTKIEPQKKRSSKVNIHNATSRKQSRNLGEAITKLAN